MGRARILLVLAFASVGCGRSGLDLLGGGGGPAGDDEADGSGGADASVLDGSMIDSAPIDAAHEQGIAELDASCTAPMIGVGYCGPGTAEDTCCKFSVAWTCGSETFRAGGACGPTLDASPQTYQGACFVNGQQTSTFMGTIGDCSCEDGGALAALARAQCGPTVQQ